MFKDISSIIAGVLISLLSVAAIAGFNMYTDLALVQDQTARLELLMKERGEIDERFHAMMMQMDKNLAVQTEAVKALKQAVSRLEDVTFHVNKKGVVHDS